MACGCAELDQRFDRALDIERARSKAGVDIDQQRQITYVGDAAHVGQHIVERIDAEIRQTERTRRNAAAGKVDRAITRAFRKQRVIGVDRTDYLQWLLGLERGTEARAGSRRGHGRSGESVHFSILDAYGARGTASLSRRYLVRGRARRVLPRARSDRRASTDRPDRAPRPAPAASAAATCRSASSAMR